MLPLATRSAVLLAAALAFASSSASAEIIVGPDAASDLPFVLDSVGEVETTFKAISTVGTKSKPSRWGAELSVLVHLKSIASDDVIVMTVKKGQKALGKGTPCRPNEIFAKQNLALFVCKSPAGRDYDASFKTAGKHTITLDYERVVEGVVFKKFASFEVVVEKLAKGAKNNPAVSWGTNHDMKLTVTTIEEKSLNSSSRGNAKIHNAIEAATRTKQIPYLAVRTWFKRKKGLERTKITCFYGKKRIAESNATGGKRFNFWTHGKKERRHETWEQASFLLYAMHPRTGAEGAKGSWATPQHWMNENPGDYRCVITGDGEILKTLTFKVGDDGEIVKSACQLASANTLRSVTLVATEDKKLVVGKADLKRGRKKGFEGRAKWAKGCPLNR